MRRWTVFVDGENLTIRGQQTPEGFEPVFAVRRALSLGSQRRTVR